jgi:Bacterial archaeo-eukaryotic release factor family 10
MISREELRQLASFECRGDGELAISFYFHPGVPRDKSHREEAILAKDLIKNALRELQLQERNRKAIEDLDRALRLAESLHGNQARGKAVFACSQQGVWKEFDLPPVALPSRLFVNRRFHLKPLAAVFSEYPRHWVALVDRHSARFLEIQFEEMREQSEFTSTQSRRSRSDGYAGYDAGHAERHSDDEVRRHYQRVADFLKQAVERHQFEALVVGCHDVNWPDLEAQLHPYVRQRLLGRFSADLRSLSDDEARSEGERIIRQSLREHQQKLIAEALSGSRSNGRGVTGLRRVLRAVELGEVENIIMTPEYSARAVECSNCGHIDSHMVSYCPACGRKTRELTDVCEALVPNAIRNNIGLVLVPPQEEFDRVGNIAAILRFRSDRNTNQMLAAS